MKRPRGNEKHAPPPLKTNLSQKFSEGCLFFWEVGDDTIQPRDTDVYTTHINNTAIIIAPVPHTGCSSCTLLSAVQVLQSQLQCCYES